MSGFIISNAVMILLKLAQMKLKVVLLIPISSANFVLFLISPLLSFLIFSYFFLTRVFIFEQNQS